MLPVSGSTSLPSCAPTTGMRGEGRVDDVLAQARIALEHEAEHGDQHERQREDREERVVSDERGEAGHAVVGELAHDREGEGRRRVSPLPAVEDAKDARP